MLKDIKKHICNIYCLGYWLCLGKQYYKECDTLKCHKYPYCVNTKKILEKIRLLEYTKPEIAIILNMDYNIFLDCLYNRDFFTWKQSLDLMLLLKLYPYEIKR